MTDLIGRLNCFVGITPEAPGSLAPGSFLNPHARKLVGDARDKLVEMRKALGKARSQLAEDLECMIECSCPLDKDDKPILEEMDEESRPYVEEMKILLAEIDAALSESAP